MGELVEFSCSNYWKGGKETGLGGLWEWSCHCDVNNRFVGYEILPIV